MSLTINELTIANVCFKTLPVKPEYLGRGLSRLKLVLSCNELTNHSSGMNFDTMIFPSVKLRLSMKNAGFSNRQGLKVSQRNHSFNCWWAVARQPSILYNSEIWPKSVEYKIVDLQSQMLSLYPGVCGFGDMRTPFLYIQENGLFQQCLSRGRQEIFMCSALLYYVSNFCRFANGARCQLRYRSSPNLYGAVLFLSFRHNCFHSE